MDVLILGSCVSRDPFGPEGSISKDGLELSVTDYYARTSMASLATQPIPDIDLSPIPSDFQKKMVKRDIEKAFLKELGSLKFDVLLIDFIDDRYDLILTDNNQGFLDSEESRKANIDLDALKARRLTCGSELHADYWLTGWNLTIDHLKKMDMLDRVLINKVFYAKSDNRGEPLPYQDWIEESNKYLKNIYNLTSKNIKESQFISHNPDRFISKFDHKWGRSPFHYTSEVEIACIESVAQFAEGLISDRDSKK